MSVLRTRAKRVIAWALVLGFLYLLLAAGMEIFSFHFTSVEITNSIYLGTIIAILLVLIAAWCACLLFANRLVRYATLGVYSLLLAYALTIWFFFFMIFWNGWRTHSGQYLVYEARLAGREYLRVYQRIDRTEPVFDRSMGHFYFSLSTYKEKDIVRGFSRWQEVKFDEHPHPIRVKYEPWKEGHTFYFNDRYVTIPPIASLKMPEFK